MPRQSYVFDRETGKLVDKEDFYAQKFAREPSKFSTVIPFPYIRGDLPAYQSPVTGKMIEGRAARREDLARSGCREVDPSEYKPIYKDYEFCQRRRLPYMGGDVPPPMTRDQKAEFRWKRAQARKAEKALTSGPEKTDPDLAKFMRGNTKTNVLAKTNSVKDA